MTTSVFARYALPSDDLIYRLQPTITASAEDPAYPATNWYNQKPAKPAKLTTSANGWWVFDFGVPVNVAAIALIYHNFDPGLDCAIQWNNVDSWVSPIGAEDIIIPAWTEDGWSVSPWVELTGTPTQQFYRLKMGDGSPGNSNPFSLGRPLMVGALRELARDVRWGVEEIGEQNVIEQPTEAGVETILDIFGPRRSYIGEFALDDAQSNQLLTLHRSAHNRVLPWLLIPNESEQDAWMVRFMDPRWSRVRQTIGHNIHPFRVQELSRGLPWP